MEELLPVFVYGTLRRGMGNDTLFSPYDVEVEDDSVKGTLYVHGLPYLAEDGEFEVKGDLVWIPHHQYEECMRDLDSLEGHPTFYTRRTVETKSGVTAWVYYYDHWLNDNFIVESGDFVLEVSK